jgi:hypothetical protein
MKIRNRLVLILPIVALLAATTETTADTGSSLASWYMLPAVTHAKGKMGTFWQTDVAIVNPYPSRQLTVYLWFFPKDRQNSPEGEDARVIVEPGGQVILRDVVVNTFGLSQGTGSMVLKTLDGCCFSVTSRIHTGQGRTYGSMQAGLRLLTQGNLSAFISGVTSDSRFRTNVGVASATGRPVDVLVGAFDGGGVFKGEEIFRLEPWGMVQIAVDEFATEFSDGYLVLTGMSAADDVKWAGYATVIDNLSGDSTYSAARTDTQHTWAKPLFDHSGWWEGSVSWAQGSLSGYLLVDQDVGCVEASMYDGSGFLRARLSGYEHLGTIYLKDIEIFDAMCGESEFVRGRITSDSDAIDGDVTVSSENAADCFDGEVTFSFAPLGESPFTRDLEKSGERAIGAWP